MNLDELRTLTGNDNLTCDDLDNLTDAYIVLDLDKKAFCKLVSCLGQGELLSRANHFARLRKALEDLEAKELYERALDRICQLDRERDQLKRIIDNYRKG